MRAVVQRVQESQVKVGDEIVGAIGPGLLVFLGVGKNDAEEQADALASKLVNLRIFEDQEGKMNCSALDTKAEILVVSQFTLYGNCDKGRRPSFDDAAPSEKAEALYNYFVGKLCQQNIKTATGKFRAMMAVALVNDGPVTFIIETK